MDPFTHAVLGGTVSIAACRHRAWVRAAALAGAIGAVLPDIDIVFHSDADPLFGLMLHRHFTHCLAFVPIGGLAAAGIALLLGLKGKVPFGWIYLFAMLGYATHAPLDAMTTYGTHIFWPFTKTREAWNLISIVDPLFTLPLFVFLILALRRHARKAAVTGLVVAIAYLGLGAIQHQRVENALQALVAKRGHTIERSEVMPSLGNLVVWRTIYEAGGKFYVDGARAGTGDVTWYEGESVKALNVPETLATLPADSPLRQDIERFDLFANGWLALLPDSPYFVADMRYAALPNSIVPFWELTFDPSHTDAHASFERHTARAEREFGKLWAMIKGE